MWSSDLLWKWILLERYLIGGEGSRCKIDSVVMFLFEFDLFISVSVLLVLICSEILLIIVCMVCWWWKFIDKFLIVNRVCVMLYCFIRIKCVVDGFINKD